MDKREKNFRTSQNLAAALLGFDQPNFMAEGDYLNRRRIFIFLLTDHVSSLNILVKKNKTTRRITIAPITY